MEKTKAIYLVIGLLLLVSSFIAYYLLAYSYVHYREVPDDMVSWFHLHVIKYIDSGLNIHDDHVLRYIDGRDLALSPILLDEIVASLNISPWSLTIIMGVIYIVSVFAISLYVLRNPLIAGLASLLFAITPGFDYWYKVNIYGAYLVQSLWLVFLLVYAIGFKKNNLLLLVLGAIIYGFLWLAWPGSWIILVVFSIYLSVLVYRGYVTKNSIIAGLLLLLFTLPLNIATGLYPITRFHIFGMIYLLSIIVVALVEYRVLGKVGEITRNAWRLVGAFIVVLLALGLVAIIESHVGKLGAYEDYYKIYVPLNDLGIMSILSIFVVLVIMRSRLLAKPIKNIDKYFLVIGFIIGLIFGFFDPTLSVFAVAALAPLLAYSLIVVVRFLISLPTGRDKIIAIIVSAWIIIGSIIASGIPAYTVSEQPPSIFYGDLSRITVAGKANQTINESALIKALMNIKEEMKQSSIIIGYWEYSYWITAALDNKAFTIADPKGSRLGQKFIAWFFLSDEETAISMVKDLVGNQTKDVYVLISEIVSLDITPGVKETKYIYIGRPIVYPPQRPGGQPTVIYQPIGDIGRIPIYVDTIGAKISDYLNLRLAKNVYEATLAWNTNTTNSVLVKLLVHALKANGYNVVNYVLSESPLENIASPKYFQLVNMTLTPMYIENTGTQVLEVCHVVAVYKVSFP